MYLDIIHTTREWIHMHTKHPTKMFTNETNKGCDILLRCTSCNSFKKIDELQRKTTSNGEESNAYRK